MKNQEGFRTLDVRNYLCVCATNLIVLQTVNFMKNRDCKVFVVCSCLLKNKHFLSTWSLKVNEFNRRNKNLAAFK